MNGNATFYLLKFLVNMQIYKNCMLMMEWKQNKPPRGGGCPKKRRQQGRQGDQQQLN